MKFFSLLAWFSLTIHLSLSVSEVSYKSLTSHTTFLFLSSSTSSLTPFVCKTFLDWICQHWLSYNKLSSNNNNNNNYYVSVIQICVSELTTCKALILYNAYVAAFVFVNIDVNSVLFVNQQQLALYAHSCQTIIILTLLSDNILFVQNYITLQQMRTHWLLYINAILIQSQSVLVFNSCIDCQKCDITLFLKCCHMSKHFSECYSNCKWHDHTVHCSVCNNDVLIIISDNKNNNSVDEDECIARSRQIALTSLLTRTVIINLKV